MLIYYLKGTFLEGNSYSILGDTSVKKNYLPLFPTLPHWNVNSPRIKVFLFCLLIALRTKYGTVGLKYIFPE